MAAGHLGHVSCLHKPVVRPEGVRRLLSSRRHAYPDLYVKIQDQQDDLVATRWRAIASTPETRETTGACGAGRGSRSSASWPGSKSTRIPPWPRAQPTVPHEQRIVILLLSAVRGRHPLSWLLDGCEQSCVRADQSRALLSDQRALNIATRLYPLIAVADRQRMVLGRWSNGCVRHPERV